MSAFEKHFSIKELATLWGLSQGCIRTLFRDRSDVLRLSRPEKRFKRKYETLRIPESVAARVYEQLKKAAA